uniref:Uncharacterized protein n=1 Tax=Helianthus annuus TaxID=4232 RepID=A0A251VGP0_HELAN
MTASSSTTNMLAVVVNRHGFYSWVGFAITDESEGVALVITTLVQSIHEVLNESWTV